MHVLVKVIPGHRISRCDHTSDGRLSPLKRLLPLPWDSGIEYMGRVFVVDQDGCAMVIWVLAKLGLENLMEKVKWQVFCKASQGIL